MKDLPLGALSTFLHRLRSAVSFDHNRSLQRMRFPRRGTGGGFIQFPAARHLHRAPTDGTHHPRGRPNPRWSPGRLWRARRASGRPGGEDSGPGSPSPGRAGGASPPGGPYAPPIKRSARASGRPAKRGPALAGARGASSAFSGVRKKKGTGFPRSRDLVTFVAPSDALRLYHIGLGLSRGHCDKAGIS